MAVFGISIPVIIRAGNMSVYGDISVDHISSKNKVTRVAIVKETALYAPNVVRYFNLLPDKNAGIDFHKDKLGITYTTQADTKSVKIAETEFELGVDIVINK